MSSSDYMDIVMEECLDLPITEGFIKDLFKTKSRKKYKQAPSDIEVEFSTKEIKVGNTPYEAHYHGPKVDIDTIKDEIKSDMPVLLKAIKEFEGKCLNQAKFYLDADNIPMNDNGRYAMIARKIIDLVQHKDFKVGFIHLDYLGNHEYEFVCGVNGAPCEIGVSRVKINGKTYTMNGI